MPDAPRPGRVADVFRGHKLLIALSAASGLLFAATTLIPPLYIRRLIAAITGASAEAAAGGGADGVSLVVVIAVLAGVFLLRGAARYCYGMTSHQAAYALLADLLQRVYRHLQQLSHRFFAGSRTGTLIARSVSDVESLEDFVAHGVPEMVQAVAIPLAMIVVLVAIDPLLTLVVLCPLPVAALVIFLLTRNIRGKWRRVRERYAEVVALVEDSLQGMSEIKSFTPRGGTGAARGPAGRRLPRRHHSRHPPLAAAFRHRGDDRRSGRDPGGGRRRRRRPWRRVAGGRPVPVPGLPDLHLPAVPEAGGHRRGAVPRPGQLPAHRRAVRGRAGYRQSSRRRGAGVMLPARWSWKR